MSEDMDYIGKFSGKLNKDGTIVIPKVLTEKLPETMYATVRKTPNVSYVLCLPSIPENQSKHTFRQREIQKQIKGDGAISLADLCLEADIPDGEIGIFAHDCSLNEFPGVNYFVEIWEKKKLDRFNEMPVGTRAYWPGP